MEDRDMLEIDIKIIPFGIRDREHLIGRMTIWNDATGDYETGNYGYKLVTDKDELFEGEFKGFDRRKGAVALSRDILDKILKE
jgi:hypothetical protein